MASFGNRKKQKLVSVYLDTNVGYCESHCYAFSQELKEFVREHSKYSNLVIKWKIPEGVAKERQFQLAKKCEELADAVEKLAQVITLPPRIPSEDIVSALVRKIKSECEELGFELIPLNMSEVDFTLLSNLAYEKKPPFNPKGADKGFKDALIAQSIVQDIGRLGTAHHTVVMSKDHLFTSYLKGFNERLANATYLTELDQLREYFAELTLNESEQHLAEVKEKCAALYFTRNKDGGVTSQSLHSKFEVRRKIEAMFLDWRNQRRLLDADPPFTKTLTIKQPTLVEVNGATYCWKSVVKFTFRLRANANRFKADEQIPTFDDQEYTGIVNVTWKVQYDKNGVFRNPQLIAISPISTDCPPEEAPTYQVSLVDFISFAKKSDKTDEKE